MQPDLSKNPVLWLGLRHVESLREAVNSTLNGNAIPNGGVRNWLEQQNLKQLEGADDGTQSERSLIVDTLDEGFKERIGIYLGQLVRGSNAPLPEWTDKGEERSGAGWRDPANFIITSAFVRLLGALEQFELDVLKALFYYRPAGLLGDPSDWVDQFVEPNVVTEEPTTDKDGSVSYFKPPLWSWLRKAAENNVERRKILKNVFDVSTLPDGYINRQRDDWYESRNKIAHGRAGVQMKLNEYLDVEGYVARSMLFISSQCSQKLRVVL